jgi:hypothetical protein
LSQIEINFPKNNRKYFSHNQGNDFSSHNLEANVCPKQMQSAIVTVVVMTFVFLMQTVPGFGPNGETGSSG